MQNQLQGPLMPKYINLEDKSKREIGGLQIYNLESNDCLILCKENGSSQNKGEASPLKGLGNERLGNETLGNKTLGNETLGNKTLENETLRNKTLISIIDLLFE